MDSLDVLKMVIFGLVAILVYFILRVIKAFVKREIDSKSLEWIPGPKGHPILGNIDLFKDETGQQSAEKPWRDFGKLVKTYGDLFRIKVGPINVLYMMRSDHVEKILTSSKLIEKAQSYGALREWLGDGLVNAGGDVWRQHRKLMTPAFHFSILDQYIPVMNAKSMLLREKLALKDPKADVFGPVITCMLEVVMEAVMDIEFDQNQNVNNLPYTKAIKIYAELIMERVFNPLYNIGPYFRLTKFGKTYLKQIETMKNFTDDIIQKRIRKMVQNGSNQNSDVRKRHKAFLDLMIDFLKDGKMSSKEIREQIDTIVFAGHDTTATAVTYALFNIGRHPDVQAKIQEELDTIFGADQDRDVDKEDLKQMIYLEAVLKESMRLFPSAPLIGRMVTDDLEVDGHVIPRETQIMIPIFIIHRDPVEYPEPEKFVPERFLADSPIADQYPNKRSSPFTYVPFSAGPRSCIGQRFAMLEAKIALANILRKYRCRSYDKPEDLRLAIELVLRPKCPIRIAFEAR